ncbi:MAG: HIT domain-containing protein [Candidatus Dojkabacteria bacterium]
MSQCTFCELIKSKNYYKVYEDKSFLAFLDINPLSEGHTLVIPKAHFRHVWELPDSGTGSVGEYFKVVQVVAKLLNARLESKEPIYSLIMGFEIPHASIHLIPNVYKGFGLTLANFLQTRKSKTIDSDVAFKVLKKLRPSLVA